MQKIYRTAIFRLRRGMKKVSWQWRRQKGLLQLTAKEANSPLVAHSIAEGIQVGWSQPYVFFVSGLICLFPCLRVVYLAGQGEDRYGEANISLLIFFFPSRLQLDQLAYTSLQPTSSIPHTSFTVFIHLKMLTFKKKKSLLFKASPNSLK